MNLDRAVEMYIKLRDRKAAIKKRHSEELKTYDEKMEQIEAALLKYFHKTGQQSAKTAHGTPYISTNMSVKLDDRGAFLKFVRENDAFEFFTNSLSKPAVKEYMEEHDDLPPGVSTSEIQTINVRR